MNTRKYIDLVTPVCRVAFHSLYEANANNKYDITLLIDKKNEAHVKMVIAAITDAKREAWGSTAGDGITYPLVDGDNTDKDIFKGHYCLRANSKSRVVVVDASGIEIPKQRSDELYSGCYGRADISFVGRELPQFGFKGVCASLNGFQKIKEGDPLFKKLSEDEVVEVRKASALQKFKDTPFDASAIPASLTVDVEELTEAPVSELQGMFDNEGV